MYKYSPFQINTQMKENTSTPPEIMQKLLNRKKTALELHRELMNIFRILNMNGFKEMQKYQLYSESKDFLKLEKHFIKHHYKLPCSEHEKIEFNPHGIKQIENILMLTVDKKRTIIKLSFEEWKKWEIETKECLKKYMAEMSEHDCYEDMEIIEDELEEVTKEIEHINKIIIRLNDAEWCIKYMYDMQYWLEEKYKEKLED